MSVFVALAALLALLVVALRGARRASMARRALVRVDPGPDPASRRPDVGDTIRALGRAARSRGPRPSDRSAFDDRLPIALEGMARALRAGTPLVVALRDASTTVGGVVGGDLRRVADGLANGRPVADALLGWVQGRPVPAVRLTVASLLLGTETGSSRARAVDRVAASLRSRAATRREISALATQARLSAVVIAVAPAAFALVGAVGDRRVALFLFTTPTGWACVVAGLALDLVSAVWMASIVRQAAS